MTPLNGVVAFSVSGAAAYLVYVLIFGRGPGPFLARLTRWWYAWQVFSYDFHLTNQKLHKRYGKIVEVMPGYYSIDDPDMHKTIYGHGTRWLKGEAYDAWHVGPGLSNLFSERNPDKHAAMRRKVAATYSMSSLVTYEPYVDQCISLYYKHLLMAADQDVELDLAHWMRCYAFDAVSMITFGYRLGFLDEGADISDLIKLLDSTRHLHTFLSIFPWLMPVVHSLRRLMTGNVQSYHQKFAGEKIELQRREAKNATHDGPVCMVKKWIIAQSEASTGSRAVTDLDIRLSAGANVGAGSETTAISLSAIAFLLYQHPEVLHRLRKEINAADLDQTPSFHSVQGLPYLQAVIWEAMRVYPASGLPLWRQVPPGGIVLGGKFFAAGTNIGASSWVTNFNTALYGEDAAEFRPERWLDDQGRLTKIAKEEHYLTFGLGSRTCIGKNISLLEINKLIPMLVRDFDIEFVNRDGSRNTDTTVRGRNMFFVKPDYLRARLRMVAPVEQEIDNMRMNG